MAPRSTRCDILLSQSLLHLGGRYSRENSSCLWSPVHLRVEVDMAFSDSLTGVHCLKESFQHFNYPQRNVSLQLIHTFQHEYASTQEGAAATFSRVVNVPWPPRPNLVLVNPPVELFGRTSTSVRIRNGYSESHELRAVS